MFDGWRTVVADWLLIRLLGALSLERCFGAPSTMTRSTVAFTHCRPDPLILRRYYASPYSQRLASGRLLLCTFLQKGRYKVLLPTLAADHWIARCRSRVSPFFILNCRRQANLEYLWPSGSVPQHARKVRGMTPCSSKADQLDQAPRTFWANAVAILPLFPQTFGNTIVSP